MNTSHLTPKDIQILASLPLADSQRAFILRIWDATPDEWRQKSLLKRIQVIAFGLLLEPAIAALVLLVTFGVVEFRYAEPLSWVAIWCAVLFRVGTQTIIAGVLGMAHDYKVKEGRIARFFVLNREILPTLFHSWFHPLQLHALACFAALVVASFASGYFWAGSAFIVLKLLSYRAGSKMQAVAYDLMSQGRSRSLELFLHPEVDASLATGAATA